MNSENNEDALYAAAAAVLTLMPEYSEMTAEKLEAVLAESKGDLASEESSEDHFLTIAETCDMLKVSKNTLHKWCRGGKLRKRHVDGRVLFNENEILAYLK